MNDVLNALVGLIISHGVLVLASVIHHVPTVAPHKQVGAFCIICTEVQASACRRRWCSFCVDWHSAVRGQATHQATHQATNQATNQPTNQPTIRPTLFICSALLCSTKLAWPAPLVPSADHPCLHSQRLAAGCRVDRDVLGGPHQQHKFHQPHRAQLINNSTNTLIKLNVRLIDKFLLHGAYHGSITHVTLFVRTARGARQSHEQVACTGSLLHSFVLSW